MQLTLKHKVNGAIIATFLLITLFFAAIQIPFQQHRFNRSINNIEMLLQTLVERDTEQLANEIFDDRIRAIALRIEEMLKIDGIISIAVFDRLGNPMVSGGMPLGELKDKRPVPTTGPQSSIFSISGMSSNLLYYSKEIEFLHEKLGTIKILYSLKAVEDDRKNAYIIIFGLLTTILMVMLIVLNLILSKAIIKPIIDLKRAARSISEGDLDRELGIGSNDEVGSLAQSFNKMQNSIKEKIHRLREEVEERQIAEDNLKITLNSIGEAVITTDMQGKITQMNPVAEQLTGWLLKEAANRPFQEVLNIVEPETGETDWDPVEKVLNGDRIDGIGTPVQLIDRNGRKYDIAHSGAPIKSVSREVFGAVHVFRDITEEKAMQSRLEQAHKLEAIGTLAGGIAHDFNNILSGIFGFSQLAINAIDEPEEAKKDIEQVIKGAHKASELVRQILTVSRKSTHKIQPMSMFFVLKEALNLLRASIPATIQIKDAVVSKATIMADPVQVHQIIMNLCTNAYHAMADSGGILAVGLNEIIFSENDRIKGGTIQPGKYLKLEVSDTGPGIKSELMDKIFEPYFTTKAPGRGTGLGLAVVFGIVKEHNGHINVYSESGQGTTFHIYFPVTEKRAKPHSPINEEQPVQGSERILLVDDEEDLLKSVHALLESLGYEISSFSSSIQAFDFFKNHQDDFDLIITDMTMPEMTGLELSGKIHECRPELPVILCTGYSEQINRQKAMDMGIHDYYEKPVVINKLTKMIRMVMDKTN